MDRRPRGADGDGPAPRAAARPRAGDRDRRAARPGDAAGDGRRAGRRPARRHARRGRARGAHGDARASGRGEPRHPRVRAEVLRGRRTASTANGRPKPAARPPAPKDGAGAEAPTKARRRKTRRDHGHQGVRVGHWTDPVGLTGCTVILCPEGSVAAADVRGGAPGTLGTDALRPGTLIPGAHAFLLTGAARSAWRRRTASCGGWRSTRSGSRPGSLASRSSPAAVLFDSAWATPARGPPPSRDTPRARPQPSGVIDEGIRRRRHRRDGRRSSPTRAPG